MDIKEMKIKKWKKIMLILFVVFLVIFALQNVSLGAVNTIFIKSIKGNNLRVQDESPKNNDHKLAEVLSKTMQLGKNLKKQEEPSSSCLKPGYKIGKTGGDATTFNWRATVGSVLSDKEWCQMVCIHPNKNLASYGNTTYVQKVLFVSEDTLTLYYTNSIYNPKVLKQSKTIGSTYTTYFRKLLREAYEAKGNTSAVRELRSHIAYKEFQDNVRKCGISKWDLGTEPGGSDKFNSSYVNLNDGFKYYGIFIFVGTGGDGSQGRIIFDVYREKEVDQVKVNIKKIDAKSDNEISHNGESVKGEFEIKAVDNCKIIDKKDGMLKKKTVKFNKLDIDFKPIDTSNKTFKFSIKEVTPPYGYLKLSDAVTITVNYDSDGKITSISSDKPSSVKITNKRYRNKK